MTGREYAAVANASEAGLSPLRASLLNGQDSSSSLDGVAGDAYGSNVTSELSRLLSRASSLLSGGAAAEPRNR